MKISRNITNILRYLIDGWIPPVLRDQKWFMWLPFKLLFKDKAHLFFDFKESLQKYNDQDIINVYEKSASVHLNRETDLNTECVEEIISDIEGKSVLEVGCGSGYLSNLLEMKNEVTAVDFVEQPSFKAINDGTRFIVADATSLPFSDNTFDVVVCTHTLEHVRNINKAIEELRRVSTEKLIIVVPKQRPYKYTFDLHIHFFPYEFSFWQLVGKSEKLKNQRIKTLGGDIYYNEER